MLNLLIQQICIQICIRSAWHALGIALSTRKKDTAEVCNLYLLTVGT